MIHQRRRPSAAPPRPRRIARRGCTLVLAALCAWGCDDGEDPPRPLITEQELDEMPSDYSFEAEELIHPHVLDVDLAWSPANPLPSEAVVTGAEAPPSIDQGFNFCSNVPQGAFDINHAAWMAFFSANVYAHFGHLGPQMHTLGFVNPNGLDQDWGQCALDLQLVAGDQAANLELFEAAIRFDKLRDYVAERFVDNDRWGPCAQEWFAQQDDDGDPEYTGAGLPEAAFLAWLVTQPKFDNHVQFGCGGSWNFDEETFEEGSTQAVVLRRDADPVVGSPPVVIVVFRGTETRWADISVDLAFFKMDLETEERTEQGWGPGWGSVHRGFFNAYMSIDEQAKAFGNYFLAEGAQPEIYITGHSLGGALATILASRILQDMELLEAAGLPTLNLRGVYTFGSPRVGNEQFMTHFNELAEKHNVTLGRVRNGDDSVTNIPAKSFNFAHVGPLFKIDEQVGGSPELDTALAVYPVLKDEPDQNLGVATDHSMAGYKSTYIDDPTDEAFNTATHAISASGYYRRLHEAFLASKDPASPLAEYNHCD